eukprot:TRINITY_DN2711_c0_g1_i5.p1 TRINITY_DN2711_c0_g1~~TRINITY_DN2711_c0_g1_i5.p1  ORF type:complete len:322 (+),score=59.18 TRINITY_DN2711_c0_g1_i5:69-1034(+)
MENAGVNLNLCKLVRDTCSKVASKAKHVHLNEDALETYAQELLSKPDSLKYVGWGENPFHKFADKKEEMLVDYVFVLDTLNFCFWPHWWEYEQLANSLKELIEKDNECFQPKNLLKLTRQTLRETIFKNEDFPLLDERLRLLHEVATQTIRLYDGKFINVIKGANQSATKLVEILTSNFRNFQDNAIYDGEQIFLYKRAQILVGDIWGAFDGKDLGYFKDIEEVTTFPDYRVPQILHHMGVMQYSTELKDIIYNKQTIRHGSDYEVEIRALTVVSVERLKERLAKDSKRMTSLEIDWLLWQKGEAIKDEIKPHHRTLSIFY